MSQSVADTIRGLLGEHARLGVDVASLSDTDDLYAAGMTSHDVVARVRRLAGTRKVGHAGTLDPMATGVLVVGINRATRLLGHLLQTDKAYDATIRLGASTSTDDAEGEIVATSPTDAVTDEAIRTGLAAMVGEIEQVPSAVSAIKVDGKRAYERVRAGEEGGAGQEGGGQKGSGRGEEGPGAAGRGGGGDGARGASRMHGAGQGQSLGAGLRNRQVHGRSSSQAKRISTPSLATGSRHVL